MRWKIVQKIPGFQPTEGKYSDWKVFLSEEAEHQCVYCSIHESSMGGIRNFHVEHYRPKSKFQDLTNTYLNLFYACPICNTFKSDDWPNEPPLDNGFSTIYYPDPSKLDYGQLFNVDTATGLISGNNVTGLYIEQKLYLNRPQLITDRKLLISINRSSVILNQSEDLLRELKKHTQSQGVIELLIELCTCLTDIIKIKDKITTSIPYRLEETKRA